MPSRALAKEGPSSARRLLASDGTASERRIFAFFGPPTLGRLGLWRIQKLIRQGYRNGVLGGNRTHNHLLRRQVLYPVELRGQLAEGLLKGLSSDCSIFSGRNFRAEEARELRELTRKGREPQAVATARRAMIELKRGHRCCLNQSAAVFRVNSRDSREKIPPEKARRKGLA